MSKKKKGKGAKRPPSGKLPRSLEKSSGGALEGLHAGALTLAGQNSLASLPQTLPSVRNPGYLEDLHKSKAYLTELLQQTVIQIADEREQIQRDLETEDAERASDGSWKVAAAKALRVLAIPVALKWGALAGGVVAWVSDLAGMRAESSAKVWPRERARISREGSPLLRNLIECRQVTEETMATLDQDIAEACKPVPILLSSGGKEPLVLEVRDDESEE